MVPHWGHTELMIVVVTADVYMRALVKDTKEKNAKAVTGQAYLEMIIYTCP